MSNQHFMSLYCKYNHPMYGKYLFIAKSGFRVCRACRRGHEIKYRTKHIDIVRANERRTTKKLVERYWQMILDAYGKACFCCGETLEDFLTLHHINGDGGEHRRNRGAAKLVFLDVIRERFPKDKYAIACMNCNFSMRFGRICPHELTRRQIP